MPPSRACDRDAAFCCMLVACKVIYDYPRGEGQRLYGRCAHGDSGQHLELQQAITLAAGWRLYLDARALVAVAARGRGAAGCCRLVRAVMALEPGMVHAPGRTGMLHWLYAQCRARGRPENVSEDEFCAELLFAGAAHLYLLFMQGTPVCKCGGLTMCSYAVCLGIVPAADNHASTVRETATTSRLSVIAGTGVVAEAPDHASTPVCEAPANTRHAFAGTPGVVPETPDDASTASAKETTPGIVPATPYTASSC